MFDLFIGETEKAFCEAIIEENGLISFSSHLSNELQNINFSDLDRVSSNSIDRCYKELSLFHINEAIIGRGDELKVNGIKKYLHKKNINFPTNTYDSIKFFTSRRGDNPLTNCATSWLIHELDQHDACSELKGVIYAHEVIIEMNAYTGRHMNYISNWLIPDFNSRIQYDSIKISSLSTSHREEIFYKYLYLFSHYINRVAMAVNNITEENIREYQIEYEDVKDVHNEDYMESMFKLADIYMGQSHYRHPNSALHPKQINISRLNTEKEYLNSTIKILRQII